MYFDGGEFQEDLSGTNWKSSCELAAAVFNVRLEDLETWNVGTPNLTRASTIDSVELMEK